MTSAIKNVVRQLTRFPTSLVKGIRISKDDLREELEQYVQFISPHFPYFNELSDAGKERFLQRVFWFKRKKIFHYQGLQPEPQIPILISACAVQITFGLSKYRMPFFRNIYVLADQYTYGTSKHPWVGHVNRSGIFLSWKHFMHGYTVHGDRYNVGLHEMAHALVYVNFLGWSGRDSLFAERFVDYKQQAEAMLHRLHLPCQLFTPQASHNYHECFAESVELFFENPVEFRQHYPELYSTLKLLLNQDPANKIKMVELAG